MKKPNVLKCINYLWFILLIGIVLVIALWGFIWKQVSDDYNRTLSENSKETMNLAKAFEEHVFRIISQNDSDLLILRKAYEEAGNIGFSDIANKIIKEKDPSRNIVAIADSGGVSRASTFSGTVGIDSSDRDFIRFHQENSEDVLFISKPFVGRSTDTSVIVLSRRINKPDGSFDGVVFMGLKIGYFLDFYKRMDLGKSQIINLLGMDGFVRARQIDDNLDFGQDIREGAVWQQVQSGQTEGTFISNTGLDKIQRITSYRVIPGYPLVILVSKSTEVALEPYEKRKENLIFLGILGSLVIFLFCFFLAKRTNRVLDEEEHRYSTLVKQASEAIIIYDFPSMKVIDANDASLKMFGYSREELLMMTGRNFSQTTDKEYQILEKILEETQLVPSEIIRYRHKLGHLIFAERTGSLIQYQGQKLAIFTYHDVTKEKRLQEVIQSEVKLAGKVQRAMVPSDYVSKKILIRTIYEPLHLVSGDFYGIKWSDDGQLLTGYILDVSGHGVATAIQTMAISTLLNEALEKEQVWSLKMLQKVNSQLSYYLAEESFAAMMTFSLDFTKREITIISGGINYFLSSTFKQNGWVALPGLFLGLSKQADFRKITLPIQFGDTFYFLTDGIADLIFGQENVSVHDFDATVQFLRKAANNPQKYDDCSAICIKIRDTVKKPLIFEYTSQERTVMRLRMLHTLTELTGRDDHVWGIAIAEAVTNGLQYGTKVRVKLCRFGDKMVVRVCDNGPGFNGQEAVRAVQKRGIETVFMERLLEENGRGIPIMLSTMDQVIYNRKGNEVLLIKRLTGD
ncbi:MAG: SpoIIE family protein phosphatase [Sporomusaceae bacterium]|nr:SpoIIE family protein phosphatase [Sporomusaceae bacterium]